MDSMGGFLKLKGDAVQMEVFTKYKPKEGSTPENPEFEPDTESKIMPWMHPLTVDEMTYIEAVGVEAFRDFQGRGGSTKDSFWRSSRVENLQLVFMALRVGKEKDAKRLFESEAEVVLLPPPEADRIVNLYYQTFRPSRDEIKNCLGERLGAGSKTS